MAHSKLTSENTATTSDGTVLRAQLAVTPHPSSGCAILRAGGDVADVDHDLTCSKTADHDRTSSKTADHDRTSSGTTECECHTAVAYDDDTHQYLTSSVEPTCICPVFEEHDCIPRIEGVDDGAVVVVVTVPHRQALRDLVDGLRRVEAEVTVEWLVEAGDAAGTAEIDVSAITDTQHETLETALEAGYYERPRETTLSELAEKLGISESAASQRLTAAETKLVRSYLD